MLLICMFSSAFEIFLTHWKIIKKNYIAHCILTLWSIKLAKCKMLNYGTFESWSWYKVY